MPVVRYGIASARYASPVGSTSSYSTQPTAIAALPAQAVIQ